MQHHTLDEYVAATQGKAGFWGNKRAYMVSLLKAWWGDAATAENDFCFDYLPRIDGDHSSYRTIADMIEGKVHGLLPRRGEPGRSGTPTAGCSGSGWPTWSGSSSATCR